MFAGQSGVPLLDLDQVPEQIYITRGRCEPRTVCVPDICPPQMRRAVPWCVEDFHLHKQLYKGKASLLYSATCRLSGTPIALKLYRKEKLSNLNWFQVEREIRIHSQLRHQYIIQLFAAFEDSENVYLAQEYAAGGDLYEDLKSHGGKLEESTVAASIVYPCLQALAYLHKLGIIHRDIKSENILLTADRTVKLADFGLSINHREERPVTRAGTLDMMAPEVLVCPEKSRPEENKERAMLAYTSAVDAWAIGIVAFELLVGHPPFEKESRSETYEHIMYRAPVMPPCVSEGARTFISAALVKAVSKRPSVETLLRHSWLQSQLQMLATPVKDGPLASDTKKVDPSANSVSITIDCTVGVTNAPSSNGSNLSSSGSAEMQEIQSNKAESSYSSKPSVLQWANSSLKTITKKLRKPVMQQAGPCQPASLQTPYAQGMTADRSRMLDAARTPTVETASMPHITARMPKLQVSACSSDDVCSGIGPPEAQENPQISPFSTYAACPEPGESSPHLSPVHRQSSRLGSGLPAAANRIGQPQQSIRTPKPPPPTLSRSLASLCLDSKKQEGSPEAQRRRSLLATKAGLEADPPSPPAYLSRPWTTQRLSKINTELPPTSPVAHTPSPLARRRRRIAGKINTSSSGSMSLADTPKGGNFPSGPKSARSFGRSANANPRGSPSERLTGEGSAVAKQLRSHHSGLLPKSGHWSPLPPASSTLSARAVRGTSTLPRELTSSLREASFRRALSAAPGTVPTARKLDLGSGSHGPSHVGRSEGGPLNGLSSTARRPSLRQ